MTKDKGQQDNIDLLVQRQRTVLDLITMGIQGDGISVETWIELRNYLIPSAARGHMSTRTAQILDYFTQYGHYRKPRRLVSLDRHLRADFDAVQRLYVNKNLLTLSPMDEIQVISTLSGESPELETQLDFMDVIGADDEEGGKQ